MSTASIFMTVQLL